MCPCRQCGARPAPPAPAGRCWPRSRPVLGKALVTKPLEIQQNRRRETASIEVRREAPGQGMLDRIGMPAELERHADVAKEPLEQKALENARLTLEALAIGAGEALFFETGPEDVGALGHPLGKRRGDAGRRRLDASIIAPESLNPSHSGPHPPRVAMSRRDYRRSGAGCTSDRLLSGAGSANRQTSSERHAEPPRKICMRPRRPSRPRTEG